MHPELHGDLRAIALAVGGGVSVADHVELVNAVDAQQLTGRAARSGIDQRRAGVLNAIQQEEIVLRAAPGDREHAADRGIRSPCAAGTLVGIVHRGRVQQQQLVVAAAVQRQFFHLARIHQSGDLVGGQIDRGGTSCTVTLSLPVILSDRLRFSV